MNEWKIVLLTGAISLIASVLSSLLTLAVTRKNEVKKHILEERTKLYFEYFPVVDLLLNHPEKVFDQEDFAKLDKKDLQLFCEEFQQKHLPNRKEVDQAIQALY